MERCVCVLEALQLICNNFRKLATLQIHSNIFHLVTPGCLNALLYDVDVLCSMQ